VLSGRIDITMRILPSHEQLDAISKNLGVERRDALLVLAHDKYIKTGITNNITDAMEMINASLPKALRQPTMITKKDDEYISRPGLTQWLQAKGWIFPKCPDCGSDMGIKALPSGDNEKTQIYCFSDKCKTAFYSADDFITVLNKFAPEGGKVFDGKRLVERIKEREQKRSSESGR